MVVASHDMLIENRPFSDIRSVKRDKIIDISIGGLCCDRLPIIRG